MKSASPFIAAAATLLLHAALIAVLAGRLVFDSAQPNPTKTVEVRLAASPPPAPPAPLPVKPPAPAPSEAKKPPEHKHQAKPQPQVAAQQRQIPTPQVRAPEPTSESTPSTTNTPAQLATPAPPAATSAPSVAGSGAGNAPPVKTSATDAAYASSNRKPPYPRLSRISGEQGTVVLRVLVKADGTAGPVEIKSSSGYPLLDESARSTVQTWRFKPATIDGKPVAEWYQLAVPFKLEGN